MKGKPTHAPTHTRDARRMRRPIALSTIAPIANGHPNTIADQCIADGLTDGGSPAAAFPRLVLGRILTNSRRRVKPRVRPLSLGYLVQGFRSDIRAVRPGNTATLNVKPREIPGRPHRFEHRSGQPALEVDGRLEAIVESQPNAKTAFVLRIYDR